MNFESCDVETLLLFKENADNKNDVNQRRLLKILLQKLINEGKTIIKKKTNKIVKKCVDKTLVKIPKNKVAHKITTSISPTVFPSKPLATPPSEPPALLCVTCLKPFNNSIEKHVCREKETKEVENPGIKIDVKEIESAIDKPIEIDNEESTFEDFGTTPASDSDSEDDSWFYEKLKSETKIIPPKSKKKRNKDRSYFKELILFECSICDKDFLIESELDEHMITHNIDGVAESASKEGKIFKCRECLKVLASTRGLKLHIRMTHSKYALKFACKESECNAAFSCKGSLDKHIFHQHKIRLQTCHICNQMFSNKYILQRHIKSVHLRLYKHICPICGKVLLDQGGLQRHISSHSDLKPYKCEQCPAAFKINADLTVHIRVHTGERPFLCTVCKRTFTCNSSLHKHMRSHGEYSIVNQEGILK